MLKKLTAIMAMATSLFAMHEAELNLNNYDLEAQLNFDVGQFNPAVQPDAVFVGMRYLHGSHQHNDSDLDKDHDLFDGHFFVQQRPPTAPDLLLGLGAKFVYTTIEKEDFYALPLGLAVRYTLPLDLPVPISIGGDIYYSPQVLSFGRAKNFMEYHIGADIMLIDRAGITAGYRKVDTDYDLDNGDLIFNETWFVGVKFRF